MRLVWFLLVLVAVTGCASHSSSTKVGVLLPLTGDFSSFGEEIRSALVAANDGSVEYVFEDTVCDPKVTASAYSKLTDVEGVHFIIGPACGSPQEVVATLSSGNAQVIMLPSAAPESLFELSKGNVFQIQYSLEKEASFVADRMYSEGYGTVVIIAYQNAFSQAQAIAFKKAYKGKVLEEIDFQDIGSDVRIAATKVKALNASAVYVADLAFFIDGGLARFGEQGVSLPVYSTYVVSMPFVRDLVENVTYSYPGGIDTEKGAVYSLAEQAGSTLISAINECSGDVDCVRSSFNKSGEFNAEGVSTRDINMYRIEDGVGIQLQRSIG
ncbi:MAG: penicillin-binding protein activator [Candidatus Woesearchaeota archaeon]